MVRTELDRNIYGLKGFRDYFEADIAGCRALAPYIVYDMPEKISLDTLDRYRDALVMIIPFQVVTNSFETLKTSPVVKSISSSELMNALYNIYDSMHNAQETINGFLETKDGKIMESMDPKILAEFFTPQGLYDAFVFMARSPEGGPLRKYIVTVAMGNNNYLVPVAEELMLRIWNVQQMIDKELS